MIRFFDWMFLGIMDFIDALLAKSKALFETIVTGYKHRANYSAMKGWYVYRSSY